MTIFPILAWIIVPIIGMVSELPLGDDVTKFIQNSGLHPNFILIFTSLLLALLAFFLVIKGIPQSFVSLIKEFNNN
jgi:hypothetical protein